MEISDWHHLLKTGSVEQRIEAVEALGKLRNWRVFVSRLGDEAPEVRLATVKAIADQRSKTVPVKPLLPVLQDESQEVQAAAIALLADSLRRRAADRHAAGQTEGLLAAALQGGPEAVRADAALALRYIRSSRPRLAGYAGDANLLVRSNAALSMVPEPDALKLLLDVLPEVRAVGEAELAHEIVLAMAAYRQAPAARDLLRAGLEDADPSYRRTVAATLSEIPDSWATSALFKASADRESAIARAALSELRDRKMRAKEQRLGRRCFDLRTEYERQHPAPAPSRSQGMVRASRRASTSSVDRVPEKPAPALANFSLFAPAALAPGSATVLSVWVHSQSDAEEVLHLAQRSFAGEELLVYSKGGVNIAIGADLTVRLSLPGLNVADPEDSFLWIGQVANVSFPVSVPSDAAAGSYPGVAKIHLQGMQVAKLHFVLTVADRPGPLEPLEVRTERKRWAFASYASDDRAEVLGRVQGMQKACPWLDVFVDVANLRSGEHWLDRLVEEIKARDVLYLFWSSAAKDSRWVDLEWRTAFEHRGIEFIDPVPLAPPNEAPPPSELSDTLHFNDWVLAYLRGAC